MLNGNGRGDRILIVDRDEQVRRDLDRLLTEAGYGCETVSDPDSAARVLEDDTVSIVVCEADLSDLSGRRPGPAVLMIGDDGDAGLVDAVLRRGAYGCLVKPFKPSEVVIAVANALDRRRHELEGQREREGLEARVAERTAALQDANARLERATDGLREAREETIRRLSRALEYRDEESGDHVERMSRYCGVVGDRLGLDGESMRAASPMHDVGKIAVPDSILLKRGQLSATERSIMERHTEVGHQLLADSDSGLLQLAASIAWTHHERFDGKGYPRGLSGGNIPIEGRIAAVADVFDALTSNRVYRASSAVDEAMEIMRSESERQFDPDVVYSFVESIDEVLDIRARYPGEVASPDEPKPPADGP